MQGDFERASFYTLSSGRDARMHNVYEEPSHQGAADNGVAIGIVFLMTVKPGLVGSLTTIIVALALGLITSIVPGGMPTMRKSPSL